MSYTKEVISDAELVRVHGNADFGKVSMREVVDDGVCKTAIGYHMGNIQLSILLEHKLVTKPRPGSYKTNLTAKGKEYARVMHNENRLTWR